MNNHYVLDIEGISPFGPESQRKKRVEDRRDGKSEVIVLEVFGSDPEKKDTRERIDEDAERDSRIIHHARHVAELLNDCEVGFPEIRIGEQSCGAHAPTHLLREEGVGCIGTDATCEAEWHVFDFPTSVDSVETGVDVFGEPNFCGSARFHEGFTTVNGVAPYADGGSPAITIDFDNSVEKFLDTASSLLDPGLFLFDAEKLRCLDKSGFGIGQMLRNDLHEEVGSWTKIGVENCEEVSLRTSKSPSKVSGFLQSRSIVPDDIFVSVILGEFLD